MKSGTGVPDEGEEMVLEEREGILESEILVEEQLWERSSQMRGADQVWTPSQLQGLRGHVFVSCCSVPRDRDGVMRREQRLDEG